MPTQCLAYRSCTRNSCHHENLLKITQFNHGFRNGQTEAWRGQVTCLRPHSTIPPSQLRLNPGSLLWPWEFQVACEEGLPPPRHPQLQKSVHTRQRRGTHGKQSLHTHHGAGLDTQVQSRRPPCSCLTFSIAASKRLPPSGPGLPDLS